MKRGLGAFAEESPIIALTSDLSQPGLGLDATQLDKLKRKTALIRHHSWEVNFNLGFETFEKSIKGVLKSLFKVNSTFSWLPVDVVAQTICDLSLLRPNRKPQIVYNNRSPQLGGRYPHVTKRSGQSSNRTHRFLSQSKRDGNDSRRNHI